MDNISLFFLIFGFSGKSQTMDNVMILGAQFIIYLTFLLMFFLFFRGGIKEKKAFVLTIVSIPLVILIIKGIHIFLFEPRPFVDYHFIPLVDNTPGASFPSRHASIMSTIAFAYVYFKSKWAPLFLLLMLWVGISRIYAGVHYPLDIIGGFLVGIISLLITKQIITLIKLRLLG